MREGAQTPGVLFSLAQKTAIAKAVAAVGIEEIELGVTTGLDPELPGLIAACRELPGRPRLALWSRCRVEDIRLAARLAPEVVSLSIPASARHIHRRLGKTTGWVTRRLTDSVHLAKDLGLGLVSLGLEDASRAEDGLLAELTGAALAAGAKRIRLADTVGIMTPDAVAGLVSSCRRWHPGLELAFHGHNDFGLATANALAALKSGAKWADVTVLGLGERAGCARLEELAGMLTLGLGEKDYRMDKMRGLCQIVARAAGTSIEPGHPLVGSRIFTCESGLHLQGLLSDPDSYEPFAPERVNAKRTLLLGAKSGVRAVAGYCQRLGFSPPAATLPALVARVRQAATELGRPLRDGEIRRLAAQCR